MKSRFRWLCVLLYLSCNSLAAQNAPITTAGTIVTLDTIATIPIRASDFNDIGSCGLTVMYDPAIVIATSVTIGPLLGGNVNTNLSIPGQIILGWYAWPGITLPDSSIIFNIHFSKVTTGTSALTWFDNGTSCFYRNGSYILLNDLPDSIYYINGSVTFQSEAPHTLAPFIKVTPGNPAAVPVRVVGLKDIGRIALTMKYDSAVLIYQSFNNNSGFPALSVYEITPGTILIQGLEQPGGPGVTLTDSSILFTLHFSYKGGETELMWKLDGGDCEYSGLPPSYPVLADDPKNSYYLNGSVTPAVGIEEPAGMISMTAYPNPFTDHTTISWNSSAKGEVSLFIFNMMGEMVDSFTGKSEINGNHNLDFSSDRLLPGIYFSRIVLKTNNKLIISKILLVCKNGD
jgi:hypothetical protein